MQVAFEALIVNWSDLQVLLVFQREGTLEKAAAKLEIDISTVSRRIRALEAALGLRIVENIGGRLVLTAYGEQAIQAAEAMEAESDNLQRAALGGDNALSGVLRVALLSIFVLFHADLLSKFEVAYPRITLEMAAGTSRVHSLARRETDVAIRVARQPDDALVGMKALHVEYAVYAHSAIADISSGRWETLPWIGWDPSVNARVIDAWMEKHVPANQVRCRVDTLVSQYLMAEAGCGACILPMVYAELSNKLVRLSDALDGFDTDIWLLTHRDLRRNRRVQAFLEHVYQGLEPLRKGSTLE